MRAIGKRIAIAPGAGVIDFRQALGAGGGVWSNAGANEAGMAADDAKIVSL